MATYKNDILFTEHLKGAFQGASDGSSGGSSDNSSDFPYRRVIRTNLLSDGYAKGLKKLVLLTPLEIPCIEFLPINYIDGYDPSFGYYPVDMALMQLSYESLDEVEYVVSNAYKKADALIQNHNVSQEEPWHRFPFCSPMKSGSFPDYESVLLMNEQIGRDMFAGRGSYQHIYTRNISPFFCLYTPEIKLDKYVEVLENNMLDFA